MYWLLFIVLGLVVGTLSGMLGIGGGILLIPVLTEFFDFNLRKAQGVTLAVLCVPVTLPGVWQYYVQGHLARRDLVVAGCIAVTFAVGAFLGARLQNGVNLTLLRTLFALLMVYMAVQLLVNTDDRAAAALAGLLVVGLTWLSYLGLRALGRAHLPPPSLGELIRKNAEPSHEPPLDYYI